jgi:hypothetical protein
MLLQFLSIKTGAAFGDEAVLYFLLFMTVAARM